ncbi:MAG: transglycosylase domain-containing protein, partial [Flavisolibacter sp.]|nr:transglycosylase domain-containing protein [Flavisolibacter sp.]
ALLAQGSRNRAWRVIEKFKEYIVAIRLERNFTKEEIISLYLNAVPYGDNVYGIKMAARTFFQKEPDRLNAVEAAVLVGMLKGNYIYNPRVHYKASFDRKNIVIGQMEKNKYITAAEASKFKTAPIVLNYKKLDENTGYAPYFREVLRNEVDEALKGLTRSDGEPYNIYDDGLKIYTTINPKMQQYAEEAQAQQMPILQRALNNQRNIKTGSVWKTHENVLEAAMKNSDRWKNLKQDGLTDAQIKKNFQQKVNMKIFAWNAKRETDTVMTPMDSIKYHRQMVQSAFMVMDPVTGEVRAWVGGINFKTWKLDHANLRTKRQVGSTIKPLLYTQAMEERGLTPESMVEDVQQSFGKDQLVPATGKTCTGRTVTMASALAWSRNCATAYIMKQVGAAQFANFMERLNIPTKLEPYPSIALGSSDLSLFEMMWGYSIFGGQGFSTKPNFIVRVEDRNGNVIKRFDYGANRKEAVSEVTAYKMTKMMEGPVTKGTAAGLMQALGAKEMAGKTGTTNDNSDFWFIGFTPQLLAGVWVGCDDRFIRIENNSFYGGTAARPIWQSFFKKVFDDKTLGIDRNAEFIKPADLENEINNADMMRIIDEPQPVDEEWGNSADDYSLDTSYRIPAESKPPADDEKKDGTNIKKDGNNNNKKDTTKKTPKIGQAPPPDEKKEKKGIFRKIFGKKENEDQQ